MTAAHRGVRGPALIRCGIPISAIGRERRRREADDDGATTGARGGGARGVLFAVGRVRAEHGAARYRAEPACHARRAAVAGRCVPAGGGHDDAGRRAARRPVRQAPAAAHRAGRVRERFAGVRAGALTAVPRGGAGRAGWGRGAGDADRAGVAHQRLPAGPAGQGRRARARWRGRRDGVRAVPRRGAGGGVVAARVLGEHPARDPRGGVRAAGRGVARRRRAAGP